jgi:hypothetical protein
MKHTLLVCSLVLINSLSVTYGQRSSDSLYRYWAVRVPLFNLVDQLSPNIQLAIERRFDKANALQLQGGVSFYNNHFGKEPNGFRLKAEYRRYFHVRKHFSFFVAAELFYTQYNTPVRGIFHDANTQKYYDDFIIQKKKYGFSPKWGLHLHGKHFLFDAYAGIGLKNRVITHTGRDNPDDERYFVRKPTIFSAKQTTGNDLTVYIPLNIAFGYIFR